MEAELRIGARLPGEVRGYRDLTADSEAYLLPHGVRDQYFSNQKTMAKALARDDYAGAYGYAIENQLMIEMRGEITSAGKVVSYPGSRGTPIKSEIDLETNAFVIQVKSGSASMSSVQREVTARYAAETNRLPVLLYNAKVTKPDARWLLDLKRTNPEFIIVPRSDFPATPVAYFKKKGF